jgi:hypothetical protein
MTPGENAFWVVEFDLFRALNCHRMASAVAELPVSSPLGEFTSGSMLPAKIEFPNEDFDEDYLKIVVTTEDFDDNDLKFGEVFLVSEKMRRAMAVGAPAVQYFDVDSSGFPPVPRSKQYQFMHVAVTENLSDPDRSDYTFRQLPDGIELFGNPKQVAFRPDAVPVHEIFYDRFFNLIFCTDAFALRVLWAGCKGVRFLDPSRLDDLGSHFRTLRGVEEARDWDNARNARVPGKLIRTIP